MSRGQPRFKLQSVLDLRTRQADQCQLQVTQLQARRTQLLAQLEQLRQQIRQVHVDQSASSDGSTHWANQWLTYLQRQRQQEALLLHQIQAQDTVIAQHQQLLTQARIKEKTLDRLKDQHLATCLQTQRYHEAAFLDEMAQRRATLL